MKASEVIEELVKAIDKYGDLEVYDNDGQEIYRVSYDKWDNSFYINIDGDEDKGG